MFVRPGLGIYLLQPQHLVSGATTSMATCWSQSQQSLAGGCSWQWGGFSHTDSHLGSGLEHSVWQRGSLQTVSHSGQRPFSQCFTGQRTSHSGWLHLIWHLEQPPM